MVRIAIDLEMEQPSGEIISVGVAWGNYYGAKDFLITPSQPISQFIQDLTGLKDNMYDWNKSRATCLEEVRDFLSTLIKDGCSDCFVTWGGGDVSALYSIMKQVGINDIPFGRRFTDTKTLYLFDREVSGLSISNKTSLNSALKANKLSFEGRQHNSADDAFNTLRLYNALIKKYSTIIDTIKTLEGLTK
jgi:inhibitor of KinA sporulation pathway (predicted exonuclease)